MREAATVLMVMTLAVCAPAGEETESVRSAEVCEVIQSAEPLADGLEESSGVVVSRRDPALLWTHNDSGWPADLFAITPSGALVARFRVEGAENVDWEDISWGPCPAGECLYIGDIGDNNASRDFVTVYRLPEPDPRGGSARVEARFDMRYPDGPRDAEGLFVLPGGEMYVVTKGGGRNRAAIYRYPGALRAGEVVELELVTRLSETPLELLEQLTGADASPSGEWIVIRSYQSLAFHRPAALLRGDTVPAYRFPLDEVEEVQGEGVALLDDGTVYLTGEAGFDDSPGTVSILRCTL